jgi:hypothetical protein
LKLIIQSAVVSKVVVLFSLGTQVVRLQRHGSRLPSDQYRHHHFLKAVTFYCKPSVSVTNPENQFPQGNPQKSVV